MHKHTCACTHIRMHRKTYAHRKTLICTHTEKYVYTRTWKSSHTQAQKRTHAETHIVKRIDTFTEERAYTDNKKACIHTHTRT